MRLGHEVGETRAHTNDNILDALDLIEGVGEFLFRVAFGMIIVSAFILSFFLSFFQHLGP